MNDWLLLTDTWWGTPACLLPRHLLVVFLWLAMLGTGACQQGTQAQQPPGEGADAGLSGGDGQTEPRDKWELWNGGTKLRGANLWQTNIIRSIYADSYGPGPFGPPVTQADFIALAALGANYVNLSHSGLFTVAPPYRLDEDAQANLDSLLAMAEAADLFVVITFRTGPGRSEFTFNRDEVGTWFQPSDLVETVWTDTAAQAAWAEMWRYTAARYRENPVVAGYDLMCEPNSTDVLYGYWEEADRYYPVNAGAIHDWNAIYPPLLAAIREVDQQTPVIIACTGWSNAVWLPYLAVSADDRTVYAIHQYAPSGYTHQTEPGLPVTYPGKLDLDGDSAPDRFNQVALAAVLDPARDYQALHGVPVCSNEYGLMRFERGAAQFLAGQTELFDRYGLNNAIWEWTPAFVSDNSEITWDEFDFCHGPDRENHTGVATSDFITVLKTYWGRNTIRPSNFQVSP